MSLSGVVPIANGGTGSATKSFVDLTTNQNVDGVKNFAQELHARLNVAGGDPSVPSAWRVVFADFPPASVKIGLGTNLDFQSGNYTTWAAAPAGHRWYTTNGQGAWQETMVSTSVGNLLVRGSFFANAFPDLAETIAADARVEQGDVVCADPRARERVTRCGPGASALLGVIATGPSGFLINAYGDRPTAELTGKPLVLAGRVPVKVSRENGPIRIGDYLTVSSSPGVAMRMVEPGPTVGVALASFDGPGDRGEVLAFIKVGERGAAAEIARLRTETAALRDRVESLERALSKLLAASPAVPPGDRIADRRVAP